jgi:hypothetical protein
VRVANKREVSAHGMPICAACGISTEVILPRWKRRAACLSELDPNLSQILSGAGPLLLEEILAFHTRNFAETRTTLEPLAHRAVALDPSDVNAYAALGWVLETKVDHEAAPGRAEQALALNANCADAYQLKGVSRCSRASIAMDARPC